MTATRARGAVLALLVAGGGACSDDPPPGAAARARDSAARVAAASAVVAAAATARRLPQICTDTTEAGALRCGMGRVARRGDTLAISLLEGAALARADRRGDDDGQGFEQYRYMGRLRGANGGPDFHLLDAQGYEYAAVELVNVRNGDSIRVPGFPVPSPDGARFAAAPLGRDDCESDGTLEIWRLGDERPVREWSIVPDDCTDAGWYPTELAWRARDTLDVGRATIPADPGRRERRERDSSRALVVRGPRGWSLVTPP